MHNIADTLPGPLLSPGRTSLAPRFSHLAADLVMALATAAFCWLAVKGLLLFAPLGVGMSSDLQNYAQMLEASAHPELFAHDPVGELLPLDPGIPNLLTVLAPFFSGANMAESLIAAGGIAIFCQLLGWYVFGRIVFGSPALSALLTVVGSITYYWAFGTYWGACHEQAVPRIFYNALWPFFLLAGTRAMHSLKARLALSLALGLAVFVHSVSALMLGGMFLTVFLLRPVRPGDARGAARGDARARGLAPGSLSASVSSGSISSRTKYGAGTTGTGISRGLVRGLVRHLAATLACTVLFAVPVIAFLLQHTPIANPDPATFETLQRIFELRFSNDWGDIRSTVSEFALALVVDFPLFPLGALALGFLLLRRDDLKGPARELVLLLPLLLVGMACVVLVCLAEMSLAPRLSRMPMSHEILRGTRFLIPMSLLSMALALSLLTNRLPRLLCGLVASATAVVIFLVSPDLVVLAARTAARDALGLEREAPARKIVEDSRLELEALRAIETNVPGDETVFAPVDAMSVRYVLRHPLEPVHKDGNIIYYTRRIDLGRDWLDIQGLLVEKPRAALEAWQHSPARWMLAPRHALPENFGNAQSSSNRLPGNQFTDHSFPGSPFCDIAFANRDWVLLKKRG